MLLKSIMTLSGLTFLSRIVGFVRDILAAAILGTGAIADAFFVAFQLPNFFRSFFAEGAFSASFVPVFSRILTQKGRIEALAFAEQTLSLMVGVLLVFVALAEAAMPAVLWLVAPGFQDNPEVMDMATTFSRITFPYLFFISLVALYGGVQNSLGRFSFFASSPVILNLTLIAGFLFLEPFFPNAGYSQSLAVFVAGLLQLLWMMLGNRALGIGFKLSLPRLSPEVRKLLKLIAPAALGASVTQLNLLIGTALASFLSVGSISYLYYANRLAQLPLGIIGVAIGTALLPLLTQQIRGNKTTQAHHSQNRAIEFGLVLTLPAGVALMIIPQTLMEILFERGEFDSIASRESALALIAYGAGVPAFVLIKALVVGFFAREDTQTPVKIAIACVVINFILNITLMRVLDHVGIALALSISSWINMILLAYVLRRRGHLIVDSALKHSVPRIILASVIMGVVIYFMDLYALPTLPEALKVPGLIALVGSGGGVYFLTLFLSGVMSVTKLKDFLRRKK